MTNDKMQYYDLKKNWAKVRRHLENRDLNDILVRDFNKFTYGRWRKKFCRGMYPTDFESSDWQPVGRGRVRPPAYWRYTKHSACHWLVNFNLKLATLVMPKEPWRIMTSDNHSTVWNGGEVIFDFNYQAFGLPASECFELAFGRELKVGKYLKCCLAEHYSSLEPPCRGQRRL